ncbi:alkaline phosphatase PhoX [Pseudonocardia sp. GCM10023141]|uniref:alkaline phosphatase PhoX n=1 Tax=Pseudonocardia sp. GCM10023141 TaxID=3252653 RepID=UPI00362337FC
MSELASRTAEPGKTEPDGLSRRGFLQRSAAAGAGVMLIGSTEMLITAPAAAAAPQQAGYGPLVADPAQRLALPKGFGYTLVSEAGATMLDSGEPTPRNHDGTGAFSRRGGGTVLVTNHEIRDPFGTDLPVPHHDGLTYDPGAAGGCTVVQVDRDGKRLGETVGVAGTATNCAGGVTPWDTWLTCEEIDALAGKDGFQKDHGYVFEVDPYDAGANADPRPIKALGRFEHEAAAVDPHLGDVYLTEDSAGPNGLLYRWKAPENFNGRRGGFRRLGATDGVLAAMKATDGAGKHVPDLSLATKTGTVYRVEWVPVPDRDGRTVATRKQFADGDITRARKLEGAWWDGPGVYIVSSFARAESPVVHDGQVWLYDPRRSTLTLKLLFTKNPDPARDGAFDGPDNISVSPYGGVILAEDGEGIQHLVGATPSGATFPMARNDFVTAKTKNVEFTGPIYSPDRKFLFANVQEPGFTFAITGPWRNQR